MLHTRDYVLTSFINPSNLNNSRGSSYSSGMFKSKKFKHSLHIKNKKIFFASGSFLKVRHFPPKFNR